jgi:hypothetical protein
MTRAKTNSYRAVTRRLHALTEEEVLTALEIEMAGERRVTVVERLHQRFSILRMQRERRALMDKLGEMT